MTTTRTLTKTGRLAGMAVIIAVIFLLQILGSFIKLGAFSVSLVLVPIVVGAAVYGAAAGGVFGSAFGIIVLINCINGIDPGGHMLWQANPGLTATLCIAKGAFAGIAAGLVYSAAANKRPYLSVVSAAIICPLVNTGIFLAAMYFFFHETLTVWAGGTSLLYFLFIGLAGLNFLFEVGVNIILCPGIVRIIDAVKRYRQ